LISTEEWMQENLEEFKRKEKFPPVRCADCRYWDAAGPSDDRRLCRRNPPTKYGAVGDDYLMGVWPRTEADDWCGEGVAK